LKKICSFCNGHGSVEGLSTQERRRCGRCEGSGYDREDADLGALLADLLARVQTLEEENAGLKAATAEAMERLKRVDDRLRRLSDAMGGY
jgi:hypothetical protein